MSVQFVHSFIHSYRYSVDTRYIHKIQPGSDGQHNTTQHSTIQYSISLLLLSLYWCRAWCCEFLGTTQGNEVISWKGRSCCILTWTISLDNNRILIIMRSLLINIYHMLHIRYILYLYSMWTIDLFCYMSDYRY